MRYNFSHRERNERDKPYNLLPDNLITPQVKLAELEFNCCKYNEKANNANHYEGFFMFLG